MLIIKSQKEFDSRVSNGVFSTDGDLCLETDIVTDANIKARDIIGKYITAKNIDAINVIVSNLVAENASVVSINAGSELIITGTLDYYLFCVANDKLDVGVIILNEPMGRHWCIHGSICIKKIHYPYQE